MDHDLDMLGRKITSLDELLKRLSAAERRRQLIKIIKQPGWTTPAEFRLVEVVVDHLSSQLKVLEKLETQLLDASQMVGEKQRQSK